MWMITLFRICLLLGFLFSAWQWGDWKNKHKYYSTILFVMVVNLSAGYLSYHHTLWIYNDDAVVTSETTVEFINTYIALPATVLMYLSNFPENGIARQSAYIVMWVLIFSTLEFIDTTLGGLSYGNGWSLKCSIVFDCFMFLIIRIHHEKPLLGWLLSGIMTAYILIAFNFLSAEMK